MRIEAPCIVSLTWTLADAQGQAIDELTEPVEFFFGGDDLLPALEEVLLGQQAGFDVHLHLEPEQAFGEYNAEWVCFENRSVFPGTLEAGMQFEGLPEGAQTADMPTGLIFTVTELYPSHVVLDGNHPLAGVALQLQVKVVAVREASADERASGTVSDGVLSVLSTAPGAQRLH